MMRKFIGVVIRGVHPEFPGIFSLKGCKQVDHRNAVDLAGAGHESMNLLERIAFVQPKQLRENSETQSDFLLTTQFACDTACLPVRIPI